MSGSGLVQFVINIIALLAAGGIFFLSIDKVAPDAFFAKIAKIAIGALLLIALVLVLAAVFGLRAALAYRRWASCGLPSASSWLWLCSTL